MPASFTINSSGEIKVKSGVTLDYETKSSYSFTAQVHDGDPDSTIDDTITVTVEVTNVEEPPGAPTGVTVATTAENTLDVSWTAPADTGAVALTHYDLRYYQGTADPSDETDWIDVDLSDFGTITSLQIPGLTAGAAYRVQVRAVGDGAGDWSSSVSGSVWPAVLCANQGTVMLRADDITLTATDSEIAVTAKSVLADNNTFYLCKAGSSTVASTSTAKMSLTHTFTGLDEGTVYWVQVHSSSHNKVTPWVRIQTKSVGADADECGCVRGTICRKFPDMWFSTRTSTHSPGTGRRRVHIDVSRQL